jgi:CheY-like chemotaxis protein
VIQKAGRCSWSDQRVGSETRNDRSTESRGPCNILAKQCRTSDQMSASLGFTGDLPILHDRKECLVALVGLERSLEANARGVMKRCGIHTLELPDLDDACRLLETLAPDAVVLDTHHPSLKCVSFGIVRLLDALSALGHDGRFVPRIVLTSAGLKLDLKTVFVSGGAVLLPAHLQHYRQLATLIRKLCGLPDDCCVVGQSPARL